jgi:biotin-(acetyl-CoA carboxylase) ligase
MTSLHDITGGRPVAADELLEAFLIRLEARVISLREGHFDLATWHSRQITTGRTVRVDMPDGSVIVSKAVGVDGATGALLVEDTASAGGERELLAGEVTHVRLAGVTP